MLTGTKFYTAAFSTILLIASACADDSSQDDIAKGLVDLETLAQTGAVVNIAGQLGIVSVPFSVAVPDASTDDVREALNQVNLTVTNTVSGVTADLTQGVLVEAEPVTPDQYTWAVSDDRLTVTLTFFNAVSTGDSLVSGGAYSAAFTVAANELIEELPQTVVPVFVQ